MNTYKNENDFFYIDKHKYGIIVSIVLSIYILLALLLHSNLIVLNTIYTVAFLISSVCIMLLIKATYNLYRGSMLLFLFIIHLYTALYSFFDLLPISYCKNIYFDVRTAKYVAFVMLNLLILYLMSKYSFNKEIKLVTLIIYVISALLSIVFLQIVFPIRFFYFITLLGASICFILTQIHLLKFKLIKGNTLNYIKLFSISSFTLTILYTISIISEYYKFTALVLSSVVGFTVFISQAYIIIEKLLKNPYKILFRDIIESNENLDYLNRKIVSRNKELIQSQMVIREKERLLKTFFTNVPLPLIILGKETERILFANYSFMNLIGKDNLREVINKKLISIITLDDSEFFIKDDGNEFFRCTSNVNGHTKYFDMELVEASKYRDEVIIVFYDVTSTIKTDKMRESVQNFYLEEGLKKEFLSNISHDLKTPINVIYSASQLIKYYMDNNNFDYLDKYNMVSKKNCITLIRLTNNLIDSSKIYSDFLSPHMEVRNIVQVVEEIVTSLVEYAKDKEIDLVFDTNQEEIFIDLDEEFMQRIIMNLISNAIKFSNINGKIEVIITDFNDEVSVVVRDNGKGMENEFLINAFNKYSMDVNNEEISEKGTGIGLFVVKKLVETQNGYINVHSEKDVGTSFEMIFKKVSQICNVN